MLTKIALTGMVALVISSPVLANETKIKSESFRQNCWVEAGTRYQIDPWLLYSIAEQESSLNPLAVNDNRNQSRDIGLMQINSSWFPKLKQFGVSEQHLFDPCTNIHVGAWILSQSILAFGNNWRAVGAYHAGTAKNPDRELLREKYAQRVYRRYVRLSAGMR